MGIVSDPGGGWKGFPTPDGADGPAGCGWADRGGGDKALRMSGRDLRDAEVSVPPRRAGRRPEYQAGRGGRAHDVSRAGTGVWPGLKTARIRRRPAWHTGHSSMSTPVRRSMRAAAGSGAGGTVGGTAVRSARQRELGRAAPVGYESEVADAHEAPREDVEEEAAEELLGRERHRFDAVPVGIVLPAEAHEALGQAHQAVVPGIPHSLDGQLTEHPLSLPHLCFVSLTLTSMPPPAVCLAVHEYRRSSRFAEERITLSAGETSNRHRLPAICRTKSPKRCHCVTKMMHMHHLLEVRSSLPLRHIRFLGGNIATVRA